MRDILSPKFSLQRFNIWLQQMSHWGNNKRKNGVRAYLKKFLVVDVSVPVQVSLFQDGIELVVIQPLAWNGLLDGNS